MPPCPRGSAGCVTGTKGQTGGQGPVGLCLPASPPAVLSFPRPPLPSGQAQQTATPSAAENTTGQAPPGSHTLSTAGRKLHLRAAGSSHEKDVSTPQHTPVPTGLLRTANKVGKEAGALCVRSGYPQDPRKWCPWEMAREAWVKKAPHTLKDEGPEPRQSRLPSSCPQAQVQDPFYPPVL